MAVTEYMSVNEEDRLEKLHLYDIVGSLASDEFDELADLASYICNTPIAQINFIDVEHQWTLSSHGMDGEKIPRKDSFCDKSIQQDEALIVEDAHKDARFKDNIFVKENPHIRFYAGVNIKSREGYNLGTVCVIDHKPRQITEQELNSLRKIAHQVEHQLERRYAKKQWERKKLYLSSTSDLQIQVDPFSLRVEELINGEQIITPGQNGSATHLDEILQISESKIYLQEWLQSAGPDSKPLQMETKVALEEASSHWYELTGVYKYGKCYITGKNIHKWKKFENDLERERKFSQSIVESVPGLLVQFDEHGYLQHWNDRVHQVVDETDQSLNGTHFAEFLPEQNHKIARSVYELQEFGSTYLEVEFPKHKENKYYYFTFVKVQYEHENTYLGIGIDVSKQFQHERELEEALEDKTALLAEVHHRVKNNLAIVSGLLELESGNYDSDVVRQGFQKSQLRIQSIAQIHEKLYGAQQFSSLLVNEYLDELLEVIDDSFDPDGVIDIHLECESIHLNINQAIPMALMVNELVVNAFQHAFDQQQKGNIQIQIRKEQNTLVMDISDDGRGLPADFDMSATSSLGMTLIKKLTTQLGGTLEITDPSQSHFHVEFPIDIGQQGAHSNSNW